MMDNDELLNCPYDPIHQIIRHRMPYHLAKCEKNYKGPPLQTCAYNAMHLCLPEKMKEHLLKCPDAITANSEKELDKAEKGYKKAMEEKSSRGSVSGARSGMSSWK